MSLSSLIIGIAIILIALPIVLTFAGDVVDDFADQINERDNAQTFGNNPVKGDLVCNLLIRVEGEQDLDRQNIFAVFNPLPQTLVIYMPQTGKTQFASGTWSDCSERTGSSLLSFFDIRQLTTQLDELRIGGNDCRRTQTCGTEGTTISPNDVNGNNIPDVEEDFDNDGIPNGEDPDSDAFGVQGYTFFDDFVLELTGTSDSNGKPLTAKFGTKLIWENDISVSNIQDVKLPLLWNTEFFLKDVKADSYSIEFKGVERSINNQRTNAPIFFTISSP